MAATQNPVQGAQTPASQSPTQREFTPYQPAHQPRRTKASSAAAREFASEILDSVEYRESLIRRVKTDTLPVQVEILLYHYKYGKPPDKIDITAFTKSLDGMSDAQIVAEADQMRERVNALLAARTIGRRIEDARRDGNLVALKSNGSVM